MKLTPGRNLSRDYCLPNNKQDTSLELYILLHSSCSLAGIILFGSEEFIGLFVSLQNVGQLLLSLSRSVSGVINEFGCVSLMQQLVEMYAWHLLVFATARVYVINSCSCTPRYSCF